MKALFQKIASFIKFVNGRFAQSSEDLVIERYHEGKFSLLVLLLVSGFISAGNIYLILLYAYWLLGLVPGPKSTIVQVVFTVLLPVNILFVWVYSFNVGNAITFLFKKRS